MVPFKTLIIVCFCQLIFRLVLNRGLSSVSGKKRLNIKLPESPLYRRRQWWSGAHSQLSLQLFSVSPRQESPDSPGPSPLNLHPTLLSLALRLRDTQSVLPRNTTATCHPLAVSLVCMDTCTQMFSTNWVLTLTLTEYIYSNTAGANSYFTN